MLPPEYLRLLQMDNNNGDDQHFQDDINEAIIQSMFEQEQNAEEEKLLREVMKISALEHQKQIGALNLDHLKKNKKKNTNQDEVSVKPQGQIPRAVELPPVEIGGKK